jgi:hypothetical protein
VSADHADTHCNVGARVAGISAIRGALAILEVKGVR